MKVTLKGDGKMSLRESVLQIIENYAEKYDFHYIKFSDKDWVKVDLQNCEINNEKSILTNCYQTSFYSECAKIREDLFEDLMARMTHSKKVDVYTSEDIQTLDMFLESVCDNDEQY